MAGVPTLALFGGDNDVVWRPLGPSVRVIKQVPLTQLQVHAVLEATAQMLANRPEHPEMAVSDE
jgi:hypothetical protein